MIRLHNNMHSEKINQVSDFLDNLYKIRNF